MSTKCAICLRRGATRKCTVCTDTAYHASCIRRAIRAGQEPTFTCCVCRSAAYSVVHDVWASICTDCREHRDNPLNNDDEALFWQNATTAQRAIKLANDSVDLLHMFLLVSTMCIAFTHHDLFEWLPWPVIVVVCVAGIANERIPVRPWFSDCETTRHAWYMALTFIGVLAVMRLALHAWHTPTYLVIAIPMLAYLWTRRTPELWVRDGTTFVIGTREMV